LQIRKQITVSIDVSVDFEANQGYNIKKSKGVTIMAKEQVVSSGAPAPLGPYSQAIKSNGFIFVSGQLAIDPAEGILKSESVHKDTKLILDNISAILEAAGSSLEKTVKFTVYLKNIDDMKFVNEAFEERLPGVKPARSAVAVAALPKNASVEIEAVAEG